VDPSVTVEFKYYNILKIITEVVLFSFFTSYDIKHTMKFLYSWVRVEIFNYNKLKLILVA
jgi:hypothetical protein